MKLIDLLAKYSLITLKDGELIELNENDKSFFLKNIKHLSSSRKAKKIYRGNNNLLQQYNCDLSNTYLLASYIFMIGEKAFEFLKKGNSKLEIIAESNCSREDIARNIWKYLQKLVNNRYESENTRQRVRSFLINNIDFRQYFLRETEDKFVDNILKIRSNKNWETVKDYYYTLFHTIGKSGNRERYYLSTTINHEVASNFNDDGIILVGWVPSQGFKERSIVYNDICKPNSLIQDFGLPYFTLPIYPDQSEFCLKCGFLPHFMAGFICRDSFIVNPWFLSSELDDDRILNGLNVDQKDFFAVLGKTNYRKSFVFDGDIFKIVENHTREVEGQ